MIDSPSHINLELDLFGSNEVEVGLRSARAHKKSSVPDSLLAKLERSSNSHSQRTLCSLPISLDKDDCLESEDDFDIDDFDVDLGDEFVLYLHRKALDENLKFLQSKDVKISAFKEKYEILQWIFAQDVIHGSRAQSIPFSFVNCCMASCLDPDVLRSGLLQVQLVRHLLIMFQFVADSDLPKLPRVYISSSSQPDDVFDAQCNVSLPDWTLASLVEQTDPVLDQEVFHPYRLFSQQRLNSFSRSNLKFNPTDLCVSN